MSAIFLILLAFDVALEDILRLSSKGLKTLSVVTILYGFPQWRNVALGLACEQSSIMNTLGNTSL